VCAVGQPTPGARSQQPAEGFAQLVGLPNQRVELFLNLGQTSLERLDGIAGYGHRSSFGVTTARAREGCNGGYGPVSQVASHARSGEG